MARSSRRTSNSLGSKNTSSLSGTLGKHAQLPTTQKRRTPKTVSVEDVRNRSFQRRTRIFVISVVGISIALAALLILRYSPLFRITTIVAPQTAHLTSENIRDLAAIPPGSTVFNLDRRSVANKIGRSPWVESVVVNPVLPNRLDIEVTERSTAAIVSLHAGVEAWRLSSSGFWLEQLPLKDAREVGISPMEQASEYASKEGIMFVSGVTLQVHPMAGIACEDEGLQALLEFYKEFSDEFKSRIVAAKVPGREAVSVVLDNGVEVSFGAPVDIALKERIALRLLQDHEGEVTYVNVRVTSAPSWRGVSNQDIHTEAAPSWAEPIEISLGSVDDLESQPVFVPEDREPPEGAVPADAEWSADGMGYYSSEGTYIYAYYDDDGNWIQGYFTFDGEWVQIS